MRYSPEIKLFWRTGLRLFHGRFLKFMSGPKCTGQNYDSVASPGFTFAQNSQVNFVVPDRKVLQEETKFVDGKNPGILHAMIDAIAVCDPQQVKTYKLCVDGKKINPSSKGEVRLWGYEDSPTYDEKQDRFAKEKLFFEDLQHKITKLIAYGHTEMHTCDDSDKEFIRAGCTKTVQLLSKRIRDLRQLKVKKDLFLDKLINKCESDWRNSRFSMVISSVKTTVYRIKNTIEELLRCNDVLCRYAAIIGSGSSFIYPEKQIPLASQGNLVCLSSTEQIENPSLIKQRSNVWFEKRKEASVTGSTINTAIGLDGLKKQKEYLEIKAGKRPEKEISEDLQKKFDHGTKNEINAVAMLVCKFLPAFHSSFSFFEEGCYINQEGQKTVLIVSPDGSIRSTYDEGIVLYGIEIKCPYPGKTFTTSVHYGLPHYYAPQVLSEMYSLRVDKLLFLSYSGDSMTIHEVEMDEPLWREIYEHIMKVDSNHIPKKLPPSILGMKSRISNFCQTKVHFLAELSSCVANPCDHSSCKDKGRIHHGSRLGNHLQVQLAALHKILLKCNDHISECHVITVQRASEVLVFLVADLDRAYKPDLPHAFPIAFALKGYSMRCEIMRMMLQDVIHEMFVRGLYIPVISYDGQWAKLAFQSGDGQPLTILELQKKLSTEIQKRSIKAICDGIFQVGIVKETSYEEVTREICIVREHSRLEVGLRSDRRVFQMTSNMVSWIQECK